MVYKFVLPSRDMGCEARFHQKYWFYSRAVMFSRMANLVNPAIV